MTLAEFMKKYCIRSRTDFTSPQGTVFATMIGVERCVDQFAWEYGRASVLMTQTFKQMAYDLSDLVARMKEDAETLDER